MMKKMNLIAALIILTLAASNAEAQRGGSLPDLRVKEVKVAWFTIAGRGAVLEVTPVIAKNSGDTFTTQSNAPMVIKIGTLNQSVADGPGCTIEVAAWTNAAETEKSFGSCALKPGQYETLKVAFAIVDHTKLVAESSEGNNYTSQPLTPAP